MTPSPLLCKELFFVKYEYCGAVTPINTLSTHVTSEKAGWTPDYSLHPCNETSQVSGGTHPLGPVEPGMTRLCRSGQSVHSGDGFTGYPGRGAPPANCVIKMIWNQANVISTVK